MSATNQNEYGVEWRVHPKFHDSGTPAMNIGIPAESLGVDWRRNINRKSMHHWRKKRVSLTLKVGF